MKTGTFDVDTPGPLVTDISGRVRDWVMETGSGSEQDLVSAFERILPRHDRYRHSHGYVVHGRDHLLPVLVSPSLTLPVHQGQVVLGTYQSVVVVDPNRDNNLRTVICSLLEG
jgi:thiamine phosphate synthase YjbQ (UPF0047 family)